MRLHQSRMRGQLGNGLRYPVLLCRQQTLLVQRQQFGRDFQQLRRLRVEQRRLDPASGIAGLQRGGIGNALPQDRHWHIIQTGGRAPRGLEIDQADAIRQQQQPVNRASHHLIAHRCGNRHWPELQAKQIGRSADCRNDGRSGGGWLLPDPDRQDRAAPARNLDDAG